MKRRILLLLAVAFLLTLFPNFALADFDPASISTPYVCLMEAETGAVLYEHNAQEQAFPASTTKIMTCILTIEMCDDLYETINIGRGFDTGGSVTRPYALTRDEEIRIIDLLYCTMMVSGNDASSALAIYLAGSQEEFANLMNKKAAEIGMVNTHFVNANGLHDENHYTTAYDMALLAQYAMKNQAFRDIVSTETFEVPATNNNPARLLENSNRLIHTKEDTDNLEYAYANGIKTGDTAYAGRCLVASAQHDGVELLLVLFGDIEGDVPSEYRFENAAKFFDWGFARFASTPVSSLNLITEFSAPISNAAFDSESAGGVSVRAELDPNAKVGGLSDEIQNLQANAASITATPIYNGGTLTAPIQAGDVVGQVEYSYNGKVLYTADLIAQDSVNEIGSIVETDPSASPLLVDAEEPKGNPFLVWFIILAVILILLVVIKLVASRRYRRRRRRRRPSAYRYRGRR